MVTERGGVCITAYPPGTRGTSKSELVLEQDDQRGWNTLALRIRAEYGPVTAIIYLALGQYKPGGGSTSPGRLPEGGPDISRLFRLVSAFLPDLLDAGNRGCLMTVLLAPPVLRAPRYDRVLPQRRRLFV